MNVGEIERLANWYLEYFQPLSKSYQRLIAPIQHNASQPNKQPFETQLTNVLNYLRGMDFEVLSLQQIRLLDQLGVSRFLGIEGANFIEATIKSSNYDPATALSELNAAFSALSTAGKHFDAFLNALNGLNLRNAGPEDDGDLITIRVGFQKEAAINNLTEWKDSAKDWYDIVRGLALASNEAPEETRVVGATTGSIILILAGTAAVTAMLAIISKHVAGVAKDGLEVLNLMEDLRQKKLLTTTMEQELQSLIETRKIDALDTILGELKPLLADANGDKIPALKNSIKKLLTFNEKGGNVDFVAPDGGEDDEEANFEGNEESRPEKGNAALSAAREAIRGYQAVREQLKMLSYQRSPAERGEGA
ncbi:hypothetical protein BSL82_07965 [Tardibacter chloracetimidivorans]|uniref:Uncharacterized protein n=1 Tax=Tardibacter chloracetimidivorans TaxID=1921510 RepID=A0A1L3ZUD8_9SPHN|nr:hypothetical protein [Tardibacter chloracetimidivorans]API59253.1 hypothetical protein BSL82_07965 [Tardibacter chloracetimidivorans]